MGVNPHELPDDHLRLRQIFSTFPSGVAAVCAQRNDRPVGMAVSAFTCVSITPPLVSVCIQRSSTTWPLLSERSALGVSILGEEQNAAAFSLSAKEGDRFAGVTWMSTRSGAILIDGAAAWLDCELHSQLDAGDHLIALLQVRTMHADANTQPLVFHGSKFRKLAPSEGF